MAVLSVQSSRVENTGPVIGALADFVLSASDDRWSPLPISSPSRSLPPRIDAGSDVGQFSLGVRISTWNAAAPAALLRAHMTLGTALLGGTAFMSGVSNDEASHLMAVACTLAIACYSDGLYRLLAMATAWT